MDSTVPTQGSIEIPELRGVLSGGRVSLAEFRSVLQEDVPGQALERIIMALRLHQLHSAG